MKHLFWVLVCVTLAAGIVSAHQAKSDERWTINSKVLSEELPISVHLPQGYHNSQDRYPVLYVLDGETLFLPLSGQTEWLQYVQRTPGIIVIGIANTKRVKNFTTPWTSATPAGDYQRIVSVAGGADGFLQFIREELIPEVEKKYRTAPFRILYGHSLGGLFALHAFSKSPGLFQAAVVISPAISWNGDEVITRLKAEFLKPSWPRGILFISASANEFGDTLPSFYRLSELLSVRAPATLRWQARVFEGEDHGTVALPAANAGFQFIFPKWRTPGLAYQEGVDGIEKFYADLSQEYGFTVAFPESEFNRLGYQALQGGDKKKAIDIFNRAVRYYPRSANAFDSLGEALEADGQLTQAREAYSKAVSIGQENNDPRLSAFRRHLDGVAAKIQRR